MTTRVEALKNYPQLGQLIAGEYVTGGGREKAPVMDPATGNSLGEYPLATPDDIDKAIAAAGQGFDVWRKTPAYDRAKILNKVAQTMRERCEYLAGLVVLELGKPFKEALGEVEQAAGMWEWSAEEGKRAYGRVIPSRDVTSRQMALLEPLGPVAAFSSWNAPLNTPSRKMSGALAAGCSIIQKASEETPACALALGKIAYECGLPEGVLSIVFGDPVMISEKLLASAVIRGVTFTGSTRIGKQIAAKAVESMKRPIMELGGHSPVLVFDDVDIEKVVAGAITGKFRNSGQICVSPTRFFVQERIYEDFTACLAEKASQLVVGDGFDPASTMGPLASPRRVAAMEEFVDDARARNLRLPVGGKRHGNTGCFYEPTVIADAGIDALVSNVEPFGPIAVVAPFSDLEQGLELSNRLPFALAAFVMTNDTRVAHRCADDIESGCILINSWRVSLPETPFGGHKDSGLASEGGVEGVRAFQNVKYVSLS